MLMMACGHNICNDCLSKNSQSHLKSAIRCEVCALETKLLQLEVSMPQRSLSRAYLTVKEILLQMNSEILSDRIDKE